jgi:hypothetical protein
MRKLPSVDATPRLSRCMVPGISVQFADHGHTFAADELVDLDAVAAPGLTWRDALGAHVDHFESVSAAEPQE